jgi:TP901 family phage tail tape measure protein
MNIVEESTVVFRLNGQTFMSELSKIESQLVSAKEKLEGMEKGTKEWKAQNAEVRKLTAAMEDSAKQMDVSQMKVSQLRTLQRDLLKVINDSVVGSEQYNKALAKLDEVNPILDNVRTQTRGINTELGFGKKMLEQFKEDFTRAFSVMSVFEVGRAVFNFVSDSVAQFKKFQSAGADLSAVTGLIGKDLEFMKDQAKKSGPEMGMMGDEMLDAYKKMASAKPELLNQKELLASTTIEAIKLAQAAKIELGPATDFLASSLNQFGRPATDAGKYINIIAAGAKEGSAEIADMAGALKNSGTVASSSNLSFEQTNAVLQSLSTIALKGGEAGSQFKNVLLTLAAGADETNPKIVGLDTALANLEKQQLSTAEISKLFGKENIVAAQHIITHRNEIATLTTKLTGTDEAYKQAAVNTNTLDFQTKQATATMSELKTEIGEGVSPVLAKLLAGVIAFVNIIRAVPSFISENRVMIAALGVAILLLNANLIVATASTLYYTAVEKGRAIVTNAVTIATTALNFAMSANPIGVVVVRIAILVGALVSWYNGSEKVRASVAGLWNALKSFVITIKDLYIAFNTFDFAKIADIFKNGASRIGDAFNVGYSTKMDAMRAEEAKKHQTSLDTNANASKKTAEDVANHEGETHKKTLTKKEEAAAKHRKSEEEKAKKAADKQAEDEKEANEKGLLEIEKLKAQSSTDELKRKRDELTANVEIEKKKVEDSKASATIKAAWIKALEAKLATDIASIEQKARDDKAKSEKEAAEKVIAENEKLNKQRITNEFEAEKAILDYMLIQARNNQSRIAELTIQRLGVERREKLAKLAEQEKSEKEALEKSYKEIIANSKLTAEELKVLEEKKQHELLAIEQKYRAENTLTTAKNQQDIAKVEADILARRLATNKKFYDGLKGLMKGDLQAFSDGLLAKMGLEKRSLSDREKNTIDWADKAQERAAEGFAFLNRMSKLTTQNQLNLLEEEKAKSIATWQEKYDTGLITKEEFEAKTQAINEEYAAKEDKLKQEAFERQKESDIASAIISGVIAIARTMAQFGFPLGLIPAAGMAAMTAIQVAEISAQRYENGGILDGSGVVQGPSHANGGIKLVRNNRIVGEVEGGEPILSKLTYKNNKPIVDKLLHSSLHQNGAPIFASGGFIPTNSSAIDDTNNSITYQADIANNTSNTNSLVSTLINITNKALGELTDLRKDMNKLLGNIDTNTAKTADKVSQTGSGQRASTFN